MYSPFPGMDPWLEGHEWPDVHHSLAFIIKQMLVPQVVPNYFVRVELYTVEDTQPDEDVGIMYPDVEILKKPAYDMVAEPAAAYGWTTPETMVIPLPSPVEVRIPVVEIVDREKRKLITAIEILSPVNKRKPGLKPYREKRESLIESGVNLIEIDLLRRFERPFNYPTLPKRAHYFVLLSRGGELRMKVWAMTVRDKLPVLPVPLKSPDPDVRLDLSAALKEVYDRSRYDLSVNYENEPAPPAFSAEDRAWLQAILKEKKLVH